MQNISQKLNVLFRFNVRDFLKTNLLQSREPPIISALYHNSPVVQPIRSNYTTLTQDDISFFQSLLGPRCLTDANEVAGYNQDWLNIYKGKGSIVLRPKTVQEVSKILARCNSRKLAVVPQGGLTSLVAGSVPTFDEVILSLSLLNKVISLNPLTGVIVAEAGCVLEQLHESAAKESLMVPLDLGAKGSCQIGGNVSTGAGGIRFIKYGSLHGNVLGLEAVLANGEVLDCMSSMRKDNTGYDLKQLLIGAEGTLGVVTKVALQLAPMPRFTQLLFLRCEGFASVPAVLRAARRVLGAQLYAIEMIDDAAFQANLRVHAGSMRNPLPPDAPPPTADTFYMLVEAGANRETHLSQLMEELYDSLAHAKELRLTAVILADDPSKVKEIWRLRETIAEGLKAAKSSATYKYDVSLPLERYYEPVKLFREKYLAEIEAEVPEVKIHMCCGYGHVGDGNIHFTVVAEGTFSQKLKDAIDRRLYRHVCAVGGSVNAEHGLGLYKNQFLAWQRSPLYVRLMGELKRTFDPNAILNPFKFFPSATPPTLT